ncbi:MAG: HEAT repeat domain-containing protein [Nitrospinae bacterium]|nr:HEAT repeat domain-containing protein [Nitrospinota bacterium]
MAGRSYLWEKLSTNKIFLCIFAGIIILFNATATGAGGERQLFIQYRNSLLSVNIQGAKLPDVVRELKKKTGLDFNYKFLPDESIFVNFNNLPLKDGIKQTIPFGTIFVYSLTTSGKEAIKSVYILSSLGLSLDKLKDVPLGLSTAPRKKINSDHKMGIEHLTRQARDAGMAYKWLLQLQNGDSRKRVEAITQLAKFRSNFFSVKALYLALEDPDNRVRSAATKSLKGLDEYNVFNSIRDELQETEAIIQKHALDAISLQKGSKWVVLLRQAIQSNQIDPSLRETAQGILLDLQARSQRN